MRKLEFPKLTLDGVAFITQNGLYLRNHASLCKESIERKKKRKQYFQKLTLGGSAKIVLKIAKGIAWIYCPYIGDTF